MKVSLYPGTLQPDEVEHVSFEKIVEITKNPTTQLQKQSAYCRQMYAKHGKTEPYSKPKLALPCFSPSGTFSSRADDNLLEHSGLVGIDFDSPDNLPTLLTQLYGSPYTHFTSVTASGDGARAIVKVDPLPTNKAEHIVAYNKVRDMYESFAKTDGGQTDLSRLSIIAADPESVYNPDSIAVKWEMPKLLTNAPVAEVATPTDNDNESPTEQEFDKVLSYVEFDENGKRSNWLQVLCVIKKYGYDDEKAWQWTKEKNPRRAAEYGEAEVKRVFETIDAERYKHCFGWLVNRAKENDYTPTRQDGKQGRRSDNGKESFCPVDLGDELMLEGRYWYTQENIHRYNEDTGVYEECLAELRRECRKRIGRISTSNKVSEVVSYLEDMNFEGEQSPGVCLQNGILNLENMVLYDHSPDNYFLQGYPVIFDNKATCYRFDQWLQEVLPDEESRTAIYEMIGSFFDPDSNLLQTAFLFTGAGSNGKSLLLEILGAIVGEENICRTPFPDFGKDRFKVATLLNKSVALDDDVQTDVPLTSTIKPLITARTLQCERKYENAFNFNLQATFVGAINGSPSTNDTSSAFWRRWCVIPFQQTFEKNAKFAMELLQETTSPASLSGIFRTAMLHYYQVKQRGSFTLPSVSAELVDTMKVDANPIHSFVEEALTLAPDGFLSRQEIATLYTDWCESYNTRPYSLRKVYDTLREYDGVVDKQRRNDGKKERGFAGIM